MPCGKPRRHRAAKAVADHDDAVEAVDVKRGDRSPSVAVQVRGSVDPIPPRTIERHCAAVPEFGDDFVPVTRAARLPVQQQNRRAQVWRPAPGGPLAFGSPPTAWASRPTYPPLPPATTTTASVSPTFFIPRCISGLTRTTPPGSSTTLCPSPKRNSTLPS